MEKRLKLKMQYRRQVDWMTTVPMQRWFHVEKSLALKASAWKESSWALEVEQAEDRQERNFAVKTVGMNFVVGAKQLTVEGSKNRCQVKEVKKMYDEFEQEPRAALTDIFRSQLRIFRPALPL